MGWLREVLQRVTGRGLFCRGGCLQPRFVIASRITPSAYVSHHSAFSYYGYTNQVSYDVWVSSGEKFNSFEFEGFTYRHVMARIDAGVEEKPDGVTVTDLECTALDSINDFEKIGGLEKLLHSFAWCHMQMKTGNCGL